MAALVCWLVGMLTRQSGHFFFEPKGYDDIDHATHEHKEEIKVGYNLRRKVVLMAIWAVSPLALWFDPTLNYQTEIDIDDVPEGIVPAIKAKKRFGSLSEANSYVLNLREQVDATTTPTTTEATTTTAAPAQ